MEPTPNYSNQEGGRKHGPSSMPRYALRKTEQYGVGSNDHSNVLRSPSNTILHEEPPPIRCSAAGVTTTSTTSTCVDVGERVELGELSMGIEAFVSHERLFEKGDGRVEGETESDPRGSRLSAMTASVTSSVGTKAAPALITETGRNTSAILGNHHGNDEPNHLPKENSIFATTKLGKKRRFLHVLIRRNNATRNMMSKVAPALRRTIGMPPSSLDLSDVVSRGGPMETVASSVGGSSISHQGPESSRYQTSDHDSTTHLPSKKRKRASPHKLARNLYKKTMRLSNYNGAVNEGINEQELLSDSPQISSKWKDMLDSRRGWGEEADPYGSEEENLEERNGSAVRGRAEHIRKWISTHPAPSTSGFEDDDAMTTDKESDSDDLYDEALEDSSAGEDSDVERGANTAAQRKTRRSNKSSTNITESEGAGNECRDNDGDDGADDEELLREIDCVSIRSKSTRRSEGSSAIPSEDEEDEGDASDTPSLRSLLCLPESDASDDGEEEPEGPVHLPDLGEHRRDIPNIAGALSGPFSSFKDDFLVYWGLSVIPSLNALICSHCGLVQGPASVASHLRSKHKIRPRHKQFYNSLQRSLAPHHIPFEKDGGYSLPMPAPGFIKPPDLAAIDGWECISCGAVGAGISDPQQIEHRCSKANPPELREVKLAKWGWLGKTLIPALDSAPNPVNNEAIMEAIRKQNRTRGEKLGQPDRTQTAEPRNPWFKESLLAQHLTKFEGKSWKKLLFLKYRCLDPPVTLVQLVKDTLHTKVEELFATHHIQLLTVIGTAFEPGPTIPGRMLRKLEKTTIRRYATLMASFVAFVCITWKLPEEERGYYLLQEHTESIEAFKRSRSPEDLLKLIVSFWCDRTQIKRCHPTQRWILIRCADRNEYIVGPEYVSPFLGRLQWVIRLAFFADAVRKYEDHELHSRIREGAARWLRQNQTDTVFSWLREILRLARGMSKRINRQGLFNYTMPGGFGYKDEVIKIEDFKLYMQKLERRLHTNFEQLLIFLGLKEDDLPSERIIDNCLPTTATSSILDSYDTSALEALQHKIATGVHNKASAPDLQFSSRWHIVYKTLTRKFLDSLLLCCYFGGGQPCRGSEILKTVIRNEDNAGSQRNIYGIFNRICYITYITKRTTILGRTDRVPHFFSEKLSSILLRYIRFLRQIELWIMQVDPSLRHISDANRRKAADFLFSTLGFTIKSDHLTSMLRRHSKAVLGLKGLGFGIKESRHVLIFIGRKYIGHDLPFERLQALLDQQAGHNSSTARSYYAISCSTHPDGMRVDILWQSKELCDLHHGFLGLMGADEVAAQYRLIPSLRAEVAALKEENARLKASLERFQAPAQNPT